MSDDSKEKERKKRALYDKRSAAEDLYIEVPFFYDRSKVFWMWDNQTYCYKQNDETDMLNEIAGKTEINTISANEKNEILEALKQVGRENIPKRIKEKWVQFHDTIVDIGTGEMFKADPDYFVTNPIPWQLGDTTETPVMDKIFNEWVGEDYVKTLYEIMAYCALPSYPIHRVFCFVGSGMNGKSKYLDLVYNFLGNSNVATSDFEQLMENRFETYALYKKLACFMGETNFSQFSKTSTVKRLTGQDQIRFEIKGKDIFTDYNYAKLLIATNSLPQTTDKTMGFYRRWTSVKFPYQFTEKKDILKDIPDQEMNNLARKCIGVLQELLKNREFHNDGDVEDRRKRYEDISDPLQRFLRENTIDNPDGHTFKFEFKDKFQTWEKRNGYRVWGDKEIGQYLNMKGFEVGKKEYPTENETKRYRAWLGLSLKKSNDQESLSKMSRISKAADSTTRAGNLSGNPLVKLDILDTHHKKPHWDSNYVHQKEPIYIDLYSGIRENMDKSEGVATLQKQQIKGGKPPVKEQTQEIKPSPPEANDRIYPQTPEGIEECLDHHKGRGLDPVPAEVMEQEFYQKVIDRAVKDGTMVEEPAGFYMKL